VKVTRAQAEQNRKTVVKVASQLFRQKGFDGVGLNDLMAAAGLTRGAFYGQFNSKEELATEASAHALNESYARWLGITGENGAASLETLTQFYLSTRHRENMGTGCPLAALSGDAARQSASVRKSFEAGLEAHLALLDSMVTPADGQDQRDASLVTLATMVGALVLSRLTKDDEQSRRFLDAASQEVIARNATNRHAKDAKGEIHR
jgi:TetR/AcrR family transcriptional regulator, transcriptional repressor for nem operon